MPLRLITGPANAGKTGEVIKEALAAVAAGASPVVVVPSLADVRRLESEFSGKGALGIRVSTLPQFTVDLWSLHGDGRRVVDDARRQAALAVVLSEGVGRELEEAAETPGFTKLVSRLCARSAAQAAPQEAVGEVRRAIDRLIDRYRQRIVGAGLVEAVWLADLLVEASPLLEGPIGIARFDALGAGDIRLLAGLARRNDVSVALTWEHTFAPTRANDNAVAFLSSIATEWRQVAETAPTHEIQQLARALYSGPAGIEPGGAVRVGLASGAEAEAALVARLVAGEIAAGVRPERIVVAFPAASRRASALETALLSRGVSADFDVSTPLLATQFGRAWFALLSLAVGRGGRAEALTYLTSPYSGVTPQAAQQRDRRWRKERVSAPTALLAAMGEDGSAGGQAVDAARRAARQPLDSGSLANWQEVADHMMASALVSHPGRSVGRAASQDAGAYQAIGRLLAEMARGATSSPDASAVLAASAGISVRERGEESANRVQVCDFRRVGARRFDAVVLGGLTEDEVSLGPHEDAEDELSAGESQRLEGGPADRLRLQFYSLLTRARSRAYLVRQEADSEGRERRASALWEDVFDAYRRPGDPADELVPAGPPCERIARADIEELAPALTARRREMRETADELDLAVLDRGVVNGEQGLSALSNASVFSATEVETYLECPYKWFYQRVVRPEEIDRVLDARELGTLAHGLLASFYREIGERSDHDRVTPEWLSEALEVFDRIAVARTAAPGFAGGLSEELDTARAAAWARNVVGQDATMLPGFVPEYVEFAFGDAAPFEFAGHAFRGRIDRIDTSPASVFVTDYKSSRDVPGLAKFEAQAKVQAVIYASVAEALLDRPVSGSVYRSMRSGRLRGFWRSDLLGGMPAGMCEDDAIGADGFAALVASTGQRVDDAIAGMRGGRIPRAPAVKGACTYCPVSAVCEGARV